MSDIKPIQTYYKGYHFRSRLEARWAVFFNALGIEWEYEPEGFKLPSGRVYLPDFRIKCYGDRGEYDMNYFYLYVEVKGEMTEEDVQKIREFSGAERLYEKRNEWESYLINFDTPEEAAVWEIENPFPSFCDHPILVVGNIPYVSQEEDVHNSRIFNNYEPMNG